MRWEAILLAAGNLEKDFAAFEPAPSKAYIRIEGKPMAYYVLQALRPISRLERIVTVIPKGAPLFPEVICVEGGDSILQSMANGFSKLLPETDMALLVTCDLPCLTQEAVLDFLNKAEQENAGLSYGFVSREDSEVQFPGAPHTYVTMKEGTFCGSGLFAVKPRDFPKLKAFADKATQSRKNIFKLAGMLGFFFMVKLFLKRLSLGEAEERAARLLGFPAKGIPSRFPEIAFNVDNLRSLELTQAIFERGVPHGRRSTAEDFNR